MNKPLTDLNFFDILFTALEHDNSVIIEYFKSKQKEYSNTETEILFHYNLCNALKVLESDYQKEWHKVKENNMRLKSIGHKPNEITDIFLAPHHYTQKEYSWQSLLNSGFGKNEIDVLKDALSKYELTFKPKFMFDIFHYLKLENNDAKRVYVNSCMAKAGKISDEQFIKECDFIKIKIIEYCSETPLIDNIPDVTQKRINKNDALIFNYVLDSKENKRKLLELENKPKHSGINHEIEMSIKNIITPELEKFAKELTNNKQQVTSASKSTGTKKEIKSFDSTLTEPQLKILYDELKDGTVKFIHSETDFKQFKALFEKKPINTIKPVKWLKYKPQLFYLLNSFIDKNFIAMPDSLYNVIENCFIDKNNKPLKNLKQSYNTFLNITSNIRYSDKLTDIVLQVLSN